MPTVGQIAGTNTDTSSNLPLRAYNLIYNTWFRDENLQSSITVDTGNGPDNPANYVLRRRGKRADYFTAALPWPQKGATAVSSPLGTTAPIKADGNAVTFANTGGQTTSFNYGGTIGNPLTGANAITGGLMTYGAPGSSVVGLYADLSAATAATINQLRQSFPIQ